MSTSALIEWLVGRGAEVDGVTVSRDTHGGRTLRVTRAFREGDVLVRVPERAMLTVEGARASSAGRALAAARGGRAPSPQMLLTAYLLGEKRRERSALSPFLASLPASFPTVPLFCPEDVLPHLRGSLAATLVVKRRDAVLREVLEIRRAVPELTGASIPELFWASTVVITRVFGLTIRGEATEALVPFADMMNHKRPPDVSWTFDDESASFVVRALRDIGAGDEICASYGRKANHRYFVHYGFALPSGADDEAAVHLSLPASSPRASEKAAALERAFGEGGDHRLSSQVKSDATQRALSYLRTASAAGGEIPRALRSLQGSGLVPPLSHRNEAAALSLLHRACLESLARFDAPFEASDEAALEQPDLAPQVRSAILVRRGEKRLLHAWGRLVDAALPILRSPRGAFFARAVGFRGEGLTTSYLTQVAMALAPKRSGPGAAGSGRDRDAAASRAVRSSRRASCP